jgi:hypothetical protein
MYVLADGAEEGVGGALRYQRLEDEAPLCEREREREGGREKEREGGREGGREGETEIVTPTPI